MVARFAALDIHRLPSRQCDYSAYSGTGIYNWHSFSCLKLQYCV